MAPDPMLELSLPAGADPTLSYARPDVEKLVHDTVKPLGGMISWAYTVTEGEFRGWQFTVNVQVDTRSHRKTAALARADVCRRAICALPWADWADGVIVSVDVTEGPFWLPDDNGAPRYVARYAIQAHPHGRTSP
jgi:hypothetical protein